MKWRVLALLSFTLVSMGGYAQFNDTTSWWSRSRRPKRELSMQQQSRRLYEQIMCGFGKNGVKAESEKGPTQQNSKFQRLQYLAELLAKHLPRIAEPKWNDAMTRHLIAQTVAETGALRAMTEKYSVHASSRKRHKGRGMCQTTHRANYAKLAGCTDVMVNMPVPRLVRWDDLAEARPQYSSELVRNPGRAMSETTEQGRLYNAMSCVCYMIDTASRHQSFDTALKSQDLESAKAIGRGINGGPGRTARKWWKPHGYEARLKAFNNTESCFKSDAPHEGFKGF